MIFTALAARRCFVLYRLVPRPDGRTDKVPTNPLTGENSNAQDDSTWMLPGVAAGYAAAYGAGYGVGIALRDPCGLFVFDLDHCVIDGKLSPIAEQFVTQFAGCYIEFSQSGTGVHIFGSYSGAPPAHSNKNSEHGIELYTARRFIALTGDLVAPEHNDPLRDATEQFQAAAFTFFQPSVARRDAELTTAASWPILGVEGVKKSKPRFAKMLEGERFYPDASAHDLEFVCYVLEAHGGNGEAALEWLQGDHGYEFSEKKSGRMDYYLPRTIATAWARLNDDPTVNVKFGGVLPELKPTPVERFNGLPLDLPASLYNCTDQANAQRLQQVYRNSLISVAGDFYAWDGKRWRLDDGLAQRFACDLSRMVREEKQALDAKISENTSSGVEFVDSEAESKALGTWAVKCEMKSTQDAALGLLRKLLNVDVDKIDADPWLLNVDNGVIDLRTGALGPHRPADLITKLSPVAYDPTATAPKFVKFLSEIVSADVVDFLQRWYGYAATGDAREQKILIKHGPGGNGKSTLDDAVNHVLGEYASPATLGLLTGKNGGNDTAHLAEIADLRGRRLVTASESEDGAKLKEALLKQLTGGDTLKGKRLYGQLFSFRPTHKLELLTNHKPVIKGSDFSIWRRIMLLSFPVKFGTPDEVAAGSATRVRDATLPAALRDEAPGILAWVVAGTRFWLSQGLNPPRSVLDANEQYRQQQDHISEFLTEMCVMDRGAVQSLQLLYQAYKGWCSTVGRDYPATRQRFVDELERRVPGFVRGKRTSAGATVGGVKLA